jgi:hypothetical protein
MFKIREFFNDLQEKHQERKKFKAAFAQLATDVKAANMASIERLFEAVTTSRFFTLDKKELLLEKAISSDNKEVFIKVLNGASPDVWFYSHSSSGPEGPHYSSKEHILHSAINSNSKNIALFLAQHPKVDVFAQGYKERTVYERGGLFSSGHQQVQKNPHSLPIVAAKEAGMQEVVDALAERMKMPHPTDSPKL